MYPTIANDVAPPPVEGDSHGTGLLGRVDVPVAGAELVLSSGRRYELLATPEGDRLTVRGREGGVVLHVLVTAAGPRLAFEGADIEIVAAGKLALSGQEVSIESRGSLVLSAQGDCTTTVAGNRRTCIGAEDRLEAAGLQVQANQGPLELRAAGRIALDGEHIGLNDDPCPRPFDWTTLAGGPTREI